MVQHYCGDAKVVENLQHLILVMHVNFQDLRKMTRILLVTKILPTGIEVNLENLVNLIKENLKDEVEFKKINN